MLAGDVKWSPHLSHVSLGCEDDGLDTVVGVADILQVTQRHQTLQHLGV